MCGEVISVLSFWATTDPATVNKLRVYRRAYEVSALRIARFVFATATNQWHAQGGRQSSFFRAGHGLCSIACHG